MAEPREIIIITSCRICDKGKHPLDVPDKACGHAREANVKHHALAVIPIDALDRAAGGVAPELVLESAANVSFSRSVSMKSDTDRRAGDRLIAMAAAIREWRG